MAFVAAFYAIGLAASARVSRVKNASDYTVADRKAGTLSVAGVIMGSLVAGGSTIGTVEMAYAGGFSAWWFTLGSGFGCALLGLGFARPLRRLGLSTLPELIEKNYGYRTALVTMIGSILGSLLSVVTQFQAGTALIRSVFPISRTSAILLISVLILSFILLGGLKSYSMLGNFKTCALYLMLISCCAICAVSGQTPAALVHDLPTTPWFNPFAFSIVRELSSCFSLVLGIVCTQIYTQGVFAAADEETARRGCLTAAALIPPLGLLAIWIGLAMRNAGIEVEPAQALPYFLMHRFHPILGGVLWATLAIAIVGGAAGLCLGVATNFSLDIFLRFARVSRDDRRVLTASRASVLLAVAICALLGLSFRSVYILQLSYVGLGLRATGMVFLIAAAVFKPGLISPRKAFVSAVSGILSMLAVWLFVPQIDALIAGLLCAFVPLIAVRDERK